MTVTALKDRDRRSKKYLSKRHGPILTRWAAARSKSWAINQTWTVEQLLTRLEEYRGKRPWDRLEHVDGELLYVDEHISKSVWCWFKEDPEPTIQHPGSHTIDQLWDVMKAEFPSFTRQKLRSLLFRLSQKGFTRRLERGVYLRRPWWDWDYDEEQDSNDPEGEKWRERYERRSLACYVALFVHYLLPHLQAYRKAKSLNLSERTYYYRINQAIEDLGEMVAVWISMRRVFAQRL